MISVIIPVYNEIATIYEILGRVARVSIPKEIIVVDDGSTDGNHNRKPLLDGRLCFGWSAGYFLPKRWRKYAELALPHANPLLIVLSPVISRN